MVAAGGTLAGYASVRWLPKAPSAFVALAVATLLHHALATVCTTCSLGPQLAIGAFDPVPAYGRALATLPLGVAAGGLVLQAAVTLGILNSVFSLLATAFVLQDEDRPPDGNRLLAKMGIASIASGLALGLPLATITSASIVARRVRDPRHGAASRRVAFAVYLVTVALIFWAGARAFALVPMAAVASAVFVIARTQFDASTWPLVRQAVAGRATRRGSAGPLLIVALVVSVGAVRSLAAALFVGALAAACLLAIEMRRSVVLAIDDGRTRRSRHVRTVAGRARLDALGDRIRVIELAHWLYFGTADELGRIVDDQHAARWVLLDARRVAGIDLTAARSLAQVAKRAAAKGVRVVLAGISDGDARRIAFDALGVDADGGLTIAADIDAALEAAEDDLLAEDGAVEPDGADVVFPGLAPSDASRLDALLSTRTVPAGTTLFRAGDVGDALYFVRSGRITLWVDSTPRGRLRILTFGAGGVFGEMALLDGQARSTHAEADTDCTLQTLSSDQLAALALDDPTLHARLLNALALQLVRRLRETTVLLDRALQ